MSFLTSAARRLSQTKDFIMSGQTQDATSIPWDADKTVFPLRKDIKDHPDQPEGARWVWGKDDYCGRLNLLTPARVKAAAAEIRTGETAPLDLPSNIPTQPSFGRQVFHHELKTLIEGKAYDDIYHMNTQSGTQWDGFRHVAHQSSATFYNGVKAADFTNGNEGSTKCSVHHWREHGFTGRGVLLDYRTWATAQGIKYDSAEPHEITYDALVEVGRAQGLDIRPAAQGGDIKPGDILFIRSGWTEDYYARSAEDNAKLAAREEGTWTGIKQQPELIDWLHDCYFSAVGGDAPAFERWPTAQKWLFHEYLLALWGVPIGEMVDLEKVAKLAHQHKRYTFFVTSAPFRTIGGVASWLNATAIF